MAKRGDPEVLRLVVIVLRSFARMTQEEFARACGLDQSGISRFEQGHQPPSEEVLRRMAAAAGMPWILVALLRRVLQALVSAANRWRAVHWGEAVQSAERAVLEPMRIAMAPSLVKASVAEIAGQRPFEEERREAGEVWAALAPFPAAQRRDLLAKSPRSGRSWALAEKLCLASSEEAAHELEAASELVELAMFVTDRVPGDETRRTHVRAHCLLYKSNVLRVADDLNAARHLFDHAATLWRANRSGLPLEEWRLLDLEASLLRAERRFEEALDRIEQARALSPGNEAAGRILLKKSSVLEQQGDPEGSLAALDEAAPWIESGGDPRLLFGLHFNRTTNLCHLERFVEAAEALPTVRELAKVQGKAGLQLLRLRWLEGRVAAGLGRTEEAVAALEEVRQAFTQQKIAYSAALVSLNLALLYLQQGRAAEVRALAEEMIWIFQEKKIRREGFAAVRLFCEAARQEVATLELARTAITEVENAERQG